MRTWKSMRFKIWKYLQKSQMQNSIHIRKFTKSAHPHQPIRAWMVVLLLLFSAQGVGMINITDVLCFLKGLFCWGMSGYWSTENFYLDICHKKWIHAAQNWKCIYTEVCAAVEGEDRMHDRRKEDLSHWPQTCESGQTWWMKPASQTVYKTPQAAALLWPTCRLCDECL